MSEITKERVEQLVRYDRKTGLFRWWVISGRRGKIRATRKNAEGYNYIHLDGKEYRACRVAWLLVYGKWPKGQIDHKNGDPSDDRIVNLRECTQSENKANSKRYKNNKTGFKGVALDLSRDRPSPYRATVSKNGRRIHIGWFASAEAAAKARDAVLAGFHGKFARRE